MADMQEKGGGGIFRKKVFIYGAVFLCAVFIVSIAVGNSPQIKSFGAKFISIAERSFFGGEKELGSVALHEKTDSGEINTATFSTSPSCIFETLGDPQRKLVVINEIAWMGGTSGADAEWIELKNISEKQVDIRGWEIIDKDEQIKIKIGDITLAPNDFFLAVKKTKNQNIKGDAMYEGGLRNTDEGLRVLNESCELEDEIIATQWPAGDNKTKKTMERKNDGSGWQTSSLPDGTPGKENSKFSPRDARLPIGQGSTFGGQIPVSTGGQAISKQIQNQKIENKGVQKIFVASTSSVATTTRINSSTSAPVAFTSPTTKTEVGVQIAHMILISEVYAGTEENAKYEFIELYNNSDSPVDLTGWTIKKKSSTGNETSLVSASRLQGKVIFPKSYFLIGNEVGYSGSPPPHATWAGSYTLAYSKNSVVVYKGTEKIDETSWEEIPKGKSITRISWGSNNFSVSEPTPGRAP